MLATPGEASRSEASPVDLAAVSMQLEQTLVQLGWKLAIARRSVAAATAALGAHAPFEQLVREALRRCLRPSA